MDLQTLAQKPLWKHFFNICNVPHPSGHEDKVREYIVNFAKNLNIECIVDEVGNVILNKKASTGYESRPHVILQAHMDMVAVKGDESTHDFLKDKIEPIFCENNEWIKANDTTLGADNGIGVATALAIVENDKLQHGPLTCIFTVEEESTMKGASHLEAKYLQADYLINIDSEETYGLYVGCQGSYDSILRFKKEYISTENCKNINFAIFNLTGGHSGANIHLGRCNANQTMASILNEVSFDYDFFIKDINGGNFRNSIPNKCNVTLAVPCEQYEDVKKALNTVFEKYKGIYASTDKNMECAIKDVESDSKALSDIDTQALITLILSLPNGALRMSEVDASVTHTSINIGTIKTLEDNIEICLMARSFSIDSLMDITNRVEGISYQCENVTCTQQNLHECWLSPSKNKAIDMFMESFKEVTNEDMFVTVMPAGLECAMFATKNKDLQLLSVGPMILDAHSQHERVKIKDCDYILEALEKALAKI